MKDFIARAVCKSQIVFSSFRFSAIFMISRVGFTWICLERGALLRQFLWFVLAGFARIHWVFAWFRTPHFAIRVSAMGLFHDFFSRIRSDSLEFTLI
jgi:hypothetical protein